METQTCATCSGSCEGQYEFTKCYSCKGSGTDPQSMTVRDVAAQVTDPSSSYYYLNACNMVEALELIHSDMELKSEFQMALIGTDGLSLKSVMHKISMKYWTDHLISLGL